MKQNARPKVRQSILRRVAKAAIALMALFIVGMIVLWNWPSAFQWVSIRMACIATGMRDRVVMIDGHPASYLERKGSSDTSSTVLCLHGFGTAKENCFLLAQMMPTTHFIAVDLPPFGESDPTSVEQFDAPSLVRFIDRFHDALHLSTVQVIGTSMGGALAVAYAAEHPEDVCALILLGPAGLCAPIENDFVRAARKDLNPISMQSIEELDQTMALVFKRVPPAPMPIKRYLVNNAVERREFIEKAAIGLRPFLLDGGLNDLLGRIHQPTLVLFGDDDQVIDASCLPLFLERMPSASGELIPDAGHVLFVDAPRAVMKAIEAFEKKLAEDGPCVSSTER